MCRLPPTAPPHSAATGCFIDLLPLPTLLPRPRSMAAPMICSACARSTSACASAVSRRAGKPRELPLLPACRPPACPLSLMCWGHVRTLTCVPCRPAESHAKAHSITDVSGNAMRFCQQCRQEGAAARHAAATLPRYALHRTAPHSTAPRQRVLPWRVLAHQLAAHTHSYIASWFPHPCPALVQQAAASGSFPRRPPQLRHQPDQA